METKSFFDLAFEMLKYMLLSTNEIDEITNKQQHWEKRKEMHDGKPPKDI